MTDRMADETTPHEAEGPGEQPGPSAASPDRWWRSRLADRVPPERRVLRAGAHLVLGAAKIAATGVRAGGTRAGGAIRSRRVEYAGTEGAPPPRPARPILKRRGGSRCESCNLTFRTPAEVTGHWIEEHSDEPTGQERHEQERRIRRSREATQKITAVVAAKRKARERPPANRGSIVARDRGTESPRAAARARHTAAQERTHRSETAKLGANAMNDPDTAAHALRRVANAIDDLNPIGRKQMYEQVAGFEVGLNIVAEALDMYAARLRREHPHGPDAREAIGGEFVNPHFTEAGQKLQEAAIALARFAANFEDVNTLAIRVAAGQAQNGGQGFLGR